MEAEGGRGTRPLPIQPGARVFPRPASFPEAGGLKGWRCDRSAGGWCREELFASLTKRLWRLCDPVQQLGRPSASGRRSLCRHPVCEQLSGLRHPPGRASTQLRGPKRRAKPGHASSHGLLVSSQGPFREALGSSQSHLPMCPKHTCRNAPLCSQGTGQLRMSSATKFNRQGLRPLCKVVSSFTGRARELFSF